MAGARPDLALTRHEVGIALGLGLAMVVFCLPGPAWLALVALVILLGLATARPGLATALTPLTFPLTFQPRDLALALVWPRPAAANLQLVPAEVATGVLVVALVGRLLIDGWRQRRRGRPARQLRPERPPPWLWLPALLLLAVATLSLFTVADPDHWRESVGEYRKVIVQPLLFASVAWLTLQRPRDRWLALLSVLLAGASIGLLGAAQCVLGRAGVSAEGVCRAIGVYQHPNNLALFVGRAAAAGLGLALTWPGLAGRRLALVLGGLAAIGLATTFSRGGWFALLGAATVLLLVAGRRRWALVVAGLAIALVGVLPLTGFERLNRLLDAGGGSGALRLDLWRSTLAMILDHPLTGIGLDQFLYQFNPRYVAPESWGERFTAHPHNLVLDFWVRLGVLGLVSGAALFGPSLWATVRLARATAGQHRAVIMACLGILVAGLLHSLVDNGFFLPDLALMYWLPTTLAARSGLASESG